MTEILWKYGWLFAICLQFALAWIGWSARNAFVPAGEFAKEQKTRNLERDAIKEAINKQGGRINHIEGAIEHFPTSGQFAEMGKAQERAAGAIETVGEKVEGLSVLVQSYQKQVSMLIENELAEGRASKNNTKGRK